MNNTHIVNIPKIGLIVVGDEILSGLRQDKHVSAVIERLKQRGLTLSWVNIVGDDRPHLTETLQRSFASDQIVFSCGGIGGTPDDHTRQAAAQALGREIQRHPEAEALIRQRCLEHNQPADEFRLRMADFPVGAEIIPNPYNRIAGFSVDQHHFVPGFPVMAWPMIEWVLDTLYPHLHHQQEEYKQSLRLFDVLEAQITPVMEALEARYPRCTLYSLPSMGDATIDKHIELGVKSRGGDIEKAEVAQAFEELQNMLHRMGKPFQFI